MDVSEIANDDTLRALVAARVDALYPDPFEFRPDVSDVIADEMAAIREELRESADEMEGEADSIEDGHAKAVVRRRLADLLEGDLS